jgi:hypothetical protein
MGSAAVASKVKGKEVSKAVQEGPAIVRNMGPGTMIDPDAPNLIVDPTINGRYKPWTKEDVLDLIDSILERGGVMLPVDLIDLGQGQFQLSAGFRRHRAVQIINHERLTPVPLKLPAVIKKMNLQEAFLRNLDENTKRRPTTVVDDAHNVERLTKYGFPDEYIRKRLSKDGKPLSEAWLSQTRTILRYEPDEQEQLNRDEVAASTAYYVATIPDRLKRQEVFKVAKEEALQDVVKDLPRDVSLKDAKEIVKEAEALVAEAVQQPGAASGGDKEKQSKLVQKVEDIAKKRGLGIRRARKLAKAAPVIAAPKVQLKHAQSAAVKTGAASDVRARKGPEVKELFSKFGGPGAGPKTQITFCNTIVDFWDGENNVDTKKVEAAFAEAFKP